MAAPPPPLVLGTLPVLPLPLGSIDLIAAMFFKATAPARPACPRNVSLGRRPSGGCQHLADSQKNTIRASFSSRKKFLYREENRPARLFENLVSTIMIANGKIFALIKLPVNDEPTSTCVLFCEIPSKFFRADVHCGGEAGGNLDNSP